MKILLTGSSGFIGKKLLERLAHIHGKEAITLLTSKPILGFDCIVYKSFQCFDADLYDVSDIDVIIHAGAFTPKNANEANLISHSNSNIYFTEQLLLMPFKNLKKIIYLSTLDVYANSEKISEESAVDPISLYGMSKLYCENLIKTFSVNKKIPYQTLRIGHVYGPGEEEYKKIIPITMSNLIQGRPVEIWGNGAELRSFIYIDDVITAIINAMEAIADVNIINIVSGISISIKDLVAKIIKVSGKDVTIVFKESSHISRNLVFDNKLLLKHLLATETDFFKGLSAEYTYMQTLRT